VFMQGTLSAGVKHVSEMLLRPWPLKPDQGALAKVG
jgi:hypothetical protein